MIGINLNYVSINYYIFLSDLKQIPNKVNRVRLSQSDNQHNQHKFYFFCIAYQLQFIIN